MLQKGDQRSNKIPKCPTKENFHLDLWFECKKLTVSQMETYGNA
jgi:hypothetical protein